MESLSTLIARFAFGWHAGLPEELVSRLREESRHRAFEDARRDEMHRQKKQEENAKADRRSMAFIEMVVHATKAAITGFTAKLDRYDVVMIEALLENERELAAVRERLQRALDEAVRLPDGRRVFKTRDGTRVFDEHGEAVALDEIRPEDISDNSIRFEDYWADRTRHQALTEEREALLDFQEKLDNTRETLGRDGLTQDELEELEAGIDAAMPQRLRRKLDDMPELTEPEAGSALASRDNPAQDVAGTRGPSFDW